ncbi:VanZ family protein [Streptomyces hydrogenans]|uniref:VanZ family protein n=1 Tax=Streptomyces hydrogenans TaxID=1873719 RepID=UPI0036A03B28
MIKAVFQDHLTFLTFAIAATLVGGFAVYAVAARRIDRGPALFYGLWASAVIGPVLLTTWGGSGNGVAVCTINPDLGAAFATTQGQLNVLLFAPFGLFAVLATRRPLFSCLIGLLFTAAVETAQATVPLISRLCDTDDLATNAVGVVAGAAVGTLICKWTPHASPLGRTTVRRAGIAGIATSLLIVTVWGATVEPVRAVLPSDVPTANAEQLRSLNIALKEAFGDTFVVDEAMFINNMEGPNTISTPLPGGYAELSWPDRERFTFHQNPTSQSEGTQPYWIPGISRPVTTAEQAEQVATDFARRYAPWAVRDAKVKAWAVDAKAKELGWVVEWRRWRGKILMPMRLNILIEPSGRMTDLIARRIQDPALPPAKIAEAEAWKRFESHHKLKPGQGEREEPVCLAERNGDEWRVHWRLAARQEDMLLSATVDATTGAVTNTSTLPASGYDQPPAALPTQQP